MRIDAGRFRDLPGVATLWDALPAARLVGGIVRDLLAGQKTADIDFASPAAPEAVMRVLATAGIKTVPTGLEHGTVTAIIDGRGFEITSLRRDVATDGRHADVVYIDDWQQDAARRDFTFNALSLERDGRLHDYFGGADDLAAGRVRFVGDPARRLAEDYLRLLRFFRFQARFGRLAPDAKTCAALGEAVPGLARLSAERIWGELKRILAALDPRTVVGLMERLGVLAAVLPEGFSSARLDDLVARGAPVDPLLRVAALLDGDVVAFAARLKLSAAERDRLLALRGSAPRGDDDALRRALADTPISVLIDRVWLADGDAGLQARLVSMPAPVFPLQGRDLASAGMAAGTAMGAMLTDLRAWWWEGGCRADCAGCLDELARRRAGGQTGAKGPPGTP